MEWDAVAQFVRSVQARDDFTKEHGKSVKTLIKAVELRPILFGLTVCASACVLVCVPMCAYAGDSACASHVISSACACACDTRCVCSVGQVLDSVAVNCSRRVREVLAEKKNVRRLINVAIEKAAASAAIAQLLVNWAFIYRWAGVCVGAGVGDGEGKRGGWWWFE